MNQTDPKTTRTRSLSKSIWKNSTLSINETFMQNIPSLFAYQNELEKTRDEIFLIKKELNKKYLDITQTKAEIAKYEDTIKKNYKIIEDITLTIDKSSAITINQLLYNPDITNLPTDLNLNPTHIAKLKELLTINILKTKSKELTKKISNQNCEIDLLKNDSKVNSLAKLENNFLINATELKELKLNYDALQLKYKAMYTQAEQVIEERDQLKLDVTKYKTEYLISKARVMKLKQNNHGLNNKQCLNDSLSANNKTDQKINSPKGDNSSNNSRHLSNENTKQFSKEVSENSIFKKQSENGRILIQAYNIEKEKLEKKIDCLCNSNQDVEELNEKKASLLQRKIAEFYDLLVKIKKIQSDLNERNTAIEHENELKRLIEKLKNEKAQWNDKTKSLEDKNNKENPESIEEKIREVQNEFIKEKKRNTELQELIDNELCKRDSLNQIVEEKSIKIEELQKEINDIKTAQEETKNNDSLYMLQPQTEHDNFFSTGINVKAKSKYEQKDENNEHNPIQEQEQEQSKEENSSGQKNNDIDQIPEEVVVSLSEEKAPKAYVPMNQKIIKQSINKESHNHSQNEERSIEEYKEKDNNDNDNAIIDNKDNKDNENIEGISIGDEVIDEDIA